MDTDSLGRRGRHKRQPNGKRLHPQPRDWVWLKKLHQHGPLPTSYLHAFTDDLGKDQARAIKRMADLFHETGLLSRPEQQNDTIDARHNQLIYAISKQGENALRSEGAYSQNAPSPTGTFKHRVMVACLTASIELACRQRADINYMPQHVILDRKNAQMRIPVTIHNPVLRRDEQHDLIPDALFGLEYQMNDRKRFVCYLLEADRGTEPITAKSKARKSIWRSLQQYRTLIGKGHYKQHFGLKSGLLVLHVTTSDVRRNNMISELEKLSEDGSNTYMLFNTADTFGNFFKPPEPLIDLLTEPWHRAGKPPFYLDAPK